MKVGSREKPEGPRCRRPYGHRIDLILSDAPRNPGPMATLIEQDPHTVIRPHFHDHHQFQVFVGGVGTMGKSSIQRFSVHYAAPESAYGPISTGDEGLSYLTLRAVGTDAGAFYMPESRMLMQRKTRPRLFTCKGHEISDASALAGRTDLEVNPLISPEPNGLAAWLLRVPPKDTTRAPDHPAKGGRFYIVAAGSLLLHGEEHGELATIWADSAEEAVDLQAGTGGLEILVLQFPQDATPIR